MEEEIDITKLKYVLYARKSTTDETQQVRSIRDQISECLELAKRKGLRVVDVLRENQSAKKPYQRPVFTQMLDDIRKGKYDAVLSWNPDRLSRNMIEAGILIDMVDNQIIKDFKFITHPFTKDANGVMLLGLSFVLSKQYSDDLSQKVTRGVRHSFLEGKSPIPKHGYVRDANGFHRPDGKNFDLICKAWELRRQGESLEKIADYMNKQGYFRKIKRTNKKVAMDKKILTDLFHDPFYYGILVQAEQKVDLRQIYKFKPATTEGVYDEVQQLSSRRLKPFNTKKRLTFYPLKALVICSSCGKNMVVGPSTAKSGKKFLYYRCDNKQCTRKKRSIRSRVIFEFIYEFLEKGLNFTQKDYDEYRKKLIHLTDTKKQQINVEIHSTEGSLKSISREIKDIALKALGQQNKTIKKVSEDRLEELENEKERLEEQLKNLKQQIANPEQDILSLQQFLNLSKNAAKIVKSANPIIKDVISRLIFLNLSVDEEKVASYQLKPPFDEMLKTRKVSSSA